MYIAIASFAAVPAERDQDFRDWFASSNKVLRGSVGLKTRRLLRAADGSYTALSEHESAGTFAAMHTAEAVSMIRAGLGKILNDSAKATGQDVVVDQACAETDRPIAPGACVEARCMCDQSNSALGEVDPEGGSLPGPGAGHADLAAVGLDESLGDGQSDAGPAVFTRSRRVDPIEAFEHVGQVLGRNAVPRVLDGKVDGRACAPGCQACAGCFN